LIARSATNNTAAMIKKSKIDCKNAPYLTSTGAPLGSLPKLIARSVKLNPPMALPSSGMNTSPTSEETILPKAAPTMTPTAKSTTLPFIANSLNSLAKLIAAPSMQF
jgi:hypothetical protein